MAVVAVRNSPGRGRGVFAMRRFAAGDTIEVCPVIPLTAAEARTLDNTALRDYYFGWGSEAEAAAIVLGYGMLYNHADIPNATRRQDLAQRTVTIFAVQPIEPGEEIFIKYNPGPAVPDGSMWFAVR